MMNQFNCGVIIVLFVLSCGRCDAHASSTAFDVTKKVRIDFNKRYQVIDSFSASDCWVPNYVGTYWSIEEKEAITTLLFSQKMKGKQPKGIGLSMWRFNLGGGTAILGDASGINDKSRRADCFLQADGTLDWTKHEGQQYFLERAQALGCKSFVLFSNTPPVYYTINGKGYSAKGAYANLKDDKYDDFANYMTDVLKYFKERKDIEFEYISPVNEPQYNWDSPNQEGSGWQNNQVSKLVRALNVSLNRKQLATKILLSEAGSYAYLYAVSGDKNRSDVIKDFFHTSSKNYIGNLSHVAPIIGGHGYWLDGTWDTLYESRTKLLKAATDAKLKIYQTEWSLLGDHYKDNYPGHNKSTHMDIAIYMSKVIHADLVYANVSSWSFWTALDVERWGHKNRFLLIRVTPRGGAYGDIAQSGTHHATKTLWVLGNYSRFIRPNYQRIDLNVLDDSKDFFGSAYLSPDSKTMVVVYTNDTSKPIHVDLTLKNSHGEFVSVQRYVTNATQNLAEQDVDDKMVIPSQSVVTLIYTSQLAQLVVLRQLKRTPYGGERHPCCVKY